VTITLFSVFGGVLILITFGMLALYLPSATKLKHHRVETSGALVGLVSEVLDGLKVIHAFGHTKYFVDTAALKTDRHHK
jgi:ABC-type multidrug transport system fused ATPase/permease subunit